MVGNFIVRAYLRCFTVEILSKLNGKLVDLFN